MYTGWSQKNTAAAKQLSREATAASMKEKNLPVVFYQQCETMHHWPRRRNLRLELTHTRLLRILFLGRPFGHKKMVSRVADYTKPLAVRFLCLASPAVLQCQLHLPRDLNTLVDTRVIQVLYCSFYNGAVGAVVKNVSARILDWVRNLFTPLPVSYYQARELREAELALQESMTRLDFANTEVLYHRKRVVRLTRELHKE